MAARGHKIGWFLSCIMVHSFPLLFTCRLVLFLSKIKMSSISSPLFPLSVSLMKSKLDPESLGIILLGPFLLEFFPEQVTMCVGM